MPYKPNDPWMICDRTGLKFRRSDMVREYTGLMVGKSEVDHRHPLDERRVPVVSVRPVKNARPEPVPTWIPRDDIIYT